MSCLAKNGTEDEVSIIVADYFEMLKLELPRVQQIRTSPVDFPTTASRIEGIN